MESKTGSAELKFSSSVLFLHTTESVCWAAVIYVSLEPRRFTTKQNEQWMSTDDYEVLQMMRDFLIDSRQDLIDRRKAKDF
jgi:hypothetical protein